MDAGEAFICSYECTWCPACAETMNKVCPNCGGELVKRPKRRPTGDSCAIENGGAP